MNRARRNKRRKMRTILRDRVKSYARWIALALSAAQIFAVTRHHYAVYS